MEVLSSGDNLGSMGYRGAGIFELVFWDQIQKIYY
jgi:hypothetical protein